MGIRARLCWPLAAVVSLVVMLAPAGVAQGRAARVYTSVHKGVLYPARSVGRARTASASFSRALTASGPPISRGARRLPRSYSGVKPNGAAGPRASGETLSSPSAAPALSVNFNGVSSRDSEITNFGQEFEPPDQGLCEGNGFVLEMVNSAYTVYKPDGTVVTGPFNVNGPFDEGLTEFTSDPRCTYDAATNTWFASILFINAAGDQSFEDLAVNTSGDPTKLWTVYRINTTDIGGSTGPKHPGCPCFGDQPRMGIDSRNVYISTDEFSILGPQFNGPQIYAIAKSSLVNPGPPSTPTHFVHFDNLSIGGVMPVAVQPAIVGSNGAEYFMNSLDPNGTFDQRIGVWAMTNLAAVANGGTPKLSSVVTQSEAYAIPPPAEQKGSSSPLDSGDDRMQQVQSLGGTLWGELDTSITIPGDPQPRAGGAWFNVRPALNGNGAIASARVLRQGYVASSGNYVLYPAVQASPSGRVAMVFTLTGASHFPSAAYAVMGPAATQFGSVAVAANGATFYDPNATRWGDYSYATLDPTGKRIWMATEYMPQGGSQTTDRAANWGTRVLSLSGG